MTDLPEQFKKYTELTQKISELEEAKDNLKHEMIDAFDDYNTNELFSEYGSFFRRSRTTYEYTDNMKEMVKRVNQLKKQEEQTGTAVIKSSIQYVVFVPPKTK